MVANNVRNLQFGSLGKDVLVIAGGSSGIGAACVSLALGYGLRVAIISRDETRLNALLLRHQASEENLRGFLGDLRDASVARSVVTSIKESFGQIGAAIVASGAAKRVSLSALDDDCWEEAFRAKFLPYIHTILSINIGLSIRGTGSIVAVVGSGGKDPDPESLPASAANAALLSALGGLARGLPAGIRLNIVNPGPVETPRYWRRVESDATQKNISVDAVHSLNCARSHMMRLGQAAEVADACLFLVSDNSSGIQGSELGVDGGGRRPSAH